MLASIVTTCVSVVLTAVSGYLVWLAQQRYKTDKKGDKAMMVLLRRELRELHDRYMADGVVTSEQLGEYNEIYDVYKDHGGNGTGTVWYADVNKLRRS